MCSSLVHLTTTARDPSLATAVESTISRLLKRKISFKFELINIAKLFLNSQLDSHGKKQHRLFLPAARLQLSPPIYWRKESFWYTIWQAENQFLQCSALISIFFCVCCEFDKRKQTLPWMCRCRITFLRSSINISSKVSRPREKMQISVASHFTPTPTSAHLSRARLALKSTIVGNRWGGVEQRQPSLNNIFVLIRAECTCGTHTTAQPIRNIFFIASQCSLPLQLAIALRWNSTVQQSHMLHRLSFRLLRFFFSPCSGPQRAALSEVNFSVAVESLAEIVSKENRRRDERRKMKLTQLFVQFKIDLTPL